MTVSSKLNSKTIVPAVFHTRICPDGPTYTASILFKINEIAVLTKTAMLFKRLVDSSFNLEDKAVAGAYYPLGIFKRLDRTNR